jgi:cobalt transporter subunit CbtA
LSLIGPALAHGDAASDGGHAAGTPDNGLERTLFTTLANVLTGIGFALILTACFALAGREVTGRVGVLWGIAGFTVASLAPALGLPPELPGTMAADLTARQSWWLLCAAATAAGLWMMVFRHGAAWTVLGAVLIAAPHLAGAPQPDGMGGSVPPELAAHFVSASLATAAVFWCLTGWLCGTAWQRLSART